ncbi:MinD/ParA family protein [Lentibacillus sp. N15]|uniref:MinD/ParA family protein n=1 Tax=Lentibacillus songyuanensis TaxID=3136161 RepID=UPI0031BB022A
MKHDQAAHLRERLAVTNHPHQAKTIAVISGKGGVGKSNVALNFSITLLQNQKKVLLIDLDVGMGNIDILLGQQTNRSLVDMLAEQRTIHEVIQSGPNGLHYIAAGSGLTELFIMDEAKMNYFLHQYHELVLLYDYIIFDMGAGATSESLAFVLAADECMVVTTPEPTAITDAYGMIKHVLNKQQKMPIYVVMNRSLTNKQGAKALARFQCVVFQFLRVTISPMGVLPDDKAVQTAVIRQIPYVLLNDKAPITTAMKRLTATYLANDEQWQQTASLSFVQKIKRFIMKR